MKRFSKVLNIILMCFLLVIFFTTSNIAKYEIGFTLHQWSFNPNQSIPCLYTQIPILIYHHFAPSWFGSNYYFTITTRVRDFERQMCYLAENGYYTLTISELYQRVATNQPIPPKSVVLTFDDGYQSVYTYAYPILKKYNLKGTLFAIYDRVGQVAGFFDPPHASWAELQEMEGSGHIDVQSHTFDLHYKDLDKVYSFLPAGLIGTPALIASKDVMETRVMILDDTHKARELSQEKLGKTPVAVAIPFGIYDPTALQALKDAGYAMVLKTYIGAGHDLFLDPCELERTYVRGYHRLADFRRLLSPLAEPVYTMQNGKISVKLLSF